MRSLKPAQDLLSLNTSQTKMVTLHYWQLADLSTVGTIPLYMCNFADLELHNEHFSIARVAAGL
jgi:hypothetical protein